MNQFSFFIFIFYCTEVLCVETDYERYLQTAQNEGLKLFSGLEKLLWYFKDNDTSPLSRKILKTFETECMYMEDTGVPQGRHRKPFIVIEGNHRPSREVVGMRLARLMGGRFLVNPAPCLTKYLDVLPKGTILRRAFYMLSLYAQAFNIKVHLNLGRTVILNGYWLDQLVFHVVQSFPTGPLPPTTSDIFKIPDDLLQPDVTFYLNFPDTLKMKGMTTRSPLSWKPRALNLYKDLQQRHTIVIQTLTGVYRDTTNDIYQHIYKTLADKRDIWAFNTNIDVDYVDLHNSSSP